MSTRLITYQAQLSLPASRAQVRNMIGAIERAGGRREFLPTATAAITPVRLHLPVSYTSEYFLPNLLVYPT